MFDYINANKQAIQVRQRVESIGADQANMLAATAVTFVALAENGAIDEVTAAEHTEMFLEWSPNVDYAAGNIRRHGECLYKCVQAHRSQDDWTPDVSPSLWVKVGDPAEEYPAWSRPIGAHDAYAEGSKVSHGDKHWVSLANNNVWEPGVYGWEEDS